MLESLPRRVYRRLFKPAPWRRWTASARMLPNFLVIGAMRAGTTTLHDLILSHPRSAGAAGKEIHFFDLYFERGPRWYRAHFPRDTTHGRMRRVTGEATPYYLFHPSAPARAAALVPQAKIIAILRHPTDRAYSHYWHTVRHGAETLSFEEALDREEARLAGEERRILEQPGYASRAHQHFSYRSRSVYAGQLERWFAHFPRGQVLVLESGRFFADLQAGSRRLFEFLGIDPQPPGSVRRRNEASYPPMKAETRKELNAFFAPHNARLFELLGESFDWAD